ncbi:DUF2264 domain-containing protein [Enhygromyxa salina]|uniref:DUF2264 domain-containing protein n=1 Tax=Enhygromyxa salina TaxID=215803 RepID=A0A2S9YWP5_9BACT|nr:DUF2264 domain-containing protein [Enhygromyxa salina]PRQ09493.1 hypothetical protein ENSA7_07350 [Enhygromyxa salina]
MEPQQAATIVGTDRKPWRWLAACSLCASLGCGPATPAADPHPTLQAQRPAKNLELDPASDWERAPYTGWTRAHYEAVFARLLLGFVAHRSPAGARTRYPGGDELPASMEGAIRMLPALGAWLACDCNPDRVRVNDQEFDVATLARDIVSNGTNPASADYWYPIGKGWAQRKVEAASVAEFLVHTRARVWENLDPFEQARIMLWLRAADEPLAANWLGFQIARNSARVAFDRPVPRGALERQLDLLEADYVGDGFYGDGAPQRFDWYNAFVIHPELTFWRAAIEHEGAREQARAHRVAARTEAFLRQLPYLFDSEGRVPPLGRSLAYRSAVLAALHSSVVAGDHFVEPGLARRMSSGNLRFHVQAGMFDDEHVLTRGHHGEQPLVLENYVRPGSQYFMTRALGVLALPPTHAFWTTPEQPLPADLGDFVRAIPAIGWMIEHDKDGAGLVLHNVGSSTRKASYHDRYKKLSYAAATWFASETEGARPYDATLVSALHRRFEMRRAGANAWAVAPGLAWSRYAIAPERLGETSAKLPVDWISSAVLTSSVSLDPTPADPAPNTSVRVSCVYPAMNSAARAYEGSLALIDRGLIDHGQTDAGSPWWYMQTSEGVGAGAVLLAGLHGWTRAGPRLDWTGPAQHVLGGEAVWIGLGVDQASPRSSCFASLQRVSAEPFDPAAVLAAAPVVELEGSHATVRWADGGLGWVDLARKPGERTLALGPVRLTGPLRMASSSERDGVRTVVGHGLRTLTDERGPLLQATQGPVTLACQIEAKRLRCEIDRPSSVNLGPDAGPATLRWQASGWSGGPTTSTEAHTVTSSKTGWIALDPPPHVTSTVIFELTVG